MTVDLALDEAAEDLRDVLAGIEASPAELEPGVVVDVDAGGLLLEAGPPVAWRAHMYLTHPEVDAGHPTILDFSTNTMVLSQIVTTGVPWSSRDRSGQSNTIALMLVGWPRECIREWWRVVREAVGVRSRPGLTLTFADVLEGCLEVESSAGSGAHLGTHQPDLVTY